MPPSKLAQSVPPVKDPPIEGFTLGFNSCFCTRKTLETTRAHRPSLGELNTRRPSATTAQFRSQSRPRPHPRPRGSSLRGSDLELA